MVIVVMMLGDDEGKDGDYENGSNEEETEEEEKIYKWPVSFSDRILFHPIPRGRGEK